MNETSIYLQKRNKVLVPAPASGHESDSAQLVATIAKNFEAYGYTLSEALAARLCILPEGQLVEFYNRVVPVLSEMRLPLQGNHSLTAIDLGDAADFRSIFTQLFATESPLSEDDRAIGRWFLGSIWDVC